MKVKVVKQAAVRRPLGCPWLIDVPSGETER